MARNTSYANQLTCQTLNKTDTIMKKTYQAPQTKQVILAVGCTILAGSPGVKSEGYNPEAEVLSRGGFYDFEEEE